MQLNLSDLHQNRDLIRDVLEIHGLFEFAWEAGVMDQRIEDHQWERRSHVLDAHRFRQNIWTYEWVLAILLARFPSQESSDPPWPTQRGPLPENQLRTLVKRIKLVLERIG